MPIYHTVLFKLKPGVTDAQKAEMKTLGRAMVGQVPGLRSFEAGPPMACTAERTKPYTMGALAILETEQDLLAYATHPAHEHLKALMKDVVDGPPLVYDLEL